ncbi:RDD family protein [Homoserinibacter sp. YIM 151385]|uniref:RDD family protein n=1 Tax=Homoserinibacter sp. YIM 151385 TaxID=2985506 RepID=UPI0022F0C027|nr:RDD family protein [Homoserinibacter sp. YIM 151385]WBU37640.1 RDD family protein [Homoserinibacter sp. YIM 151385]
MTDPGEPQIQGAAAPAPDHGALAAALGLVPAPLGRRALAFAIEVAIVAVLLSIGWIVYAVVIAQGTANIASGAVDPGEIPNIGVGIAALVVTSVLALVFALMQLLLHGIKGVTLGKWLLGIRSVRLETLGQPGFGPVLLRGLVLWAAGAVPLGQAVLLASVLWDGSGRNRSWLDRIGGIWMVDVRRGPDPYDEDAMRVAHAVVEARAEVAPPPPPAAPAPPQLSPADDPETILIGEETLHQAPTARVAPAPGAVAPAPAAPAAPAETPSAAEPRPPVPVAEPAAPPAAGPPIAPPPWETQAPAAPPPAAPEPAPTRGTLVADDGARIPVDPVVLVGRNPALRPGEPVVAVHALEDPTLSLSKSHALVGIDAEGPWIVDRGSSNGTSVDEPGRPRTLLTPEQRTRLAWDQTIRLGDRRFTIVRG